MPLILIWSKLVLLNLKSFKNIYSAKVRPILDHIPLIISFSFFSSKFPNPILIFCLVIFFDLKRGPISFPDHYNYFDKELENLINKAKENNTILLTTEKDYLRIDDNYKKNINFLKIAVEIENRNQFIEEIKKVIWKLLNIFLNL